MLLEKVNCLDDIALKIQGLYPGSCIRYESHWIKRLVVPLGPGQLVYFQYSVSDRWTGWVMTTTSGQEPLLITKEQLTSRMVEDAVGKVIKQWSNPLGDHTITKKRSEQSMAIINSALITAAESNNPERAMQLLNSGVECTIETVEDMVQFATKNNHSALLQKLLDNYLN